MSQFNLNETTFGIEIEACVPVEKVREFNIVVGGYHRGIQVAALPTGWNAQSDNSIACDCGYVGIEFVSPKLQGEDGIQQVEKVCEWLNSIGAKVNKSTGLHVHIGVAGLDAAALARLIALVSYNEKAIYASTGTKSREQGRYCQTIKHKYRPVTQEKKADNSVLNRLVSHSHDRYYILNLAPLASGLRQAVEFRAFAGTTNATKVKAYIQLCLALAHKAATSTRMVAWDAKPTKDREFAAKGEGFVALTHLLKNLGWIKPGLKPFVCGLIRTEERAEMVRELTRLADKYDAA
jgi:hypothetical protein